MSLRLVMVTRRFWPLPGGTAKSAAYLAAELAARGQEVTLLTACWNPQWPRTIYYRGIRVVRLPAAPRGRWSTMRYLRLLSLWLRRHHREYDLVFVSRLEEEACAALRAVGKRKPVVLRPERSGVQGDCVRQERNWSGRRMQQRCRAAAAIVSPSRLIGRELAAAGYDPARIHAIPRGVPIPPETSPATKADARDALVAASTAFHIPPGVPLAVYAGKLDKSRDLHTLLAAWTMLSRSASRARLWLVGEGPEHWALRDQIDDAGMSGRVLLAGAFDDAAELLRAADLAVLPAKEGGSPMAMLEAMAAGLPIVAADLPVYRELARDGDEALFATPADHVGWAQQIDRLLADPPLAERLGAAARKRAAEEFSIARMADRYVQLFEELTGNSPGRESTTP